MSTYDTEFGLNEEVLVRKTGGKRGTVKEIILSTNGKNFTQEYGVEFANPHGFSHYNRGQLQKIS